jgi:hypothetical protein
MTDKNWPGDTEIDYSDEVLPGTDTRSIPAAKKCSCGVPSEADYYLDGVIGRGTAKTGTETEELSEFRCAAHAPTRSQYSRMLREETTDESTAFYGPWKVLEFKRRKLQRIGSQTIVDLTKGGK